MADIKFSKALKGSLEPSSWKFCEGILNRGRKVFQNVGMNYHLSVFSLKPSTTHLCVYEEMKGSR